MSTEAMEIARKLASDECRWHVRCAACGATYYTDVDGDCELCRAHAVERTSGREHLVARLAKALEEAEQPTKNPREDGAGLLIVRRAGEVLHIEDLYDDGEVRRITIEVRTTASGSVRLGVLAPAGTIIRRGEVPFAGACERCGDLIRPSKRAEATGHRFCSDCLRSNP